MRVLVTGGAGFIGSYIADALLAAKHEVTVLDDLSSGRRENVPDGARFVEGDIVSPDVADLLREVRPEAVVHCAAQVSVSASIADPEDDLNRNIRGMVNLIQSCRRTGVGVLVYSSSAAVYGSPQYVPIDESHPTLPLSPYGLSKLAAEGYLRILATDAGIRWVILRYANVFGPRQLPHGDGAVVPAFLSAFAAGQDPMIQGTGEQTRDFVFVTDVARANVLAVTGSAQGTYNIGTDAATSINDFWRLAAKTMGWNRAPVYGPPRPGDILHSRLSARAARKALGWEPQVSLSEGLERTADAFRN